MLEVEVVVEPFVDGDPGPHVRAAWDAARRADVDLAHGPFASTLTGADQAVLGAVDAMVRAALAAGATRVAVQVSRPDAPAG